MCPFYHVYFTPSTDWPWPLKCILWGFTLQVTSCLLSRGKTKYATLGMRLWCKYIRNYLLVYQLTSHFLPYLRNYKEFEGEISDLQLEKYGLSFKTKKYTTSGWARGGGDENVIGKGPLSVCFDFKMGVTAVIDPGTLNHGIMYKQWVQLLCSQKYTMIENTTETIYSNM